MPALRIAQRFRPDIALKSFIPKPRIQFIRPYSVSSTQLPHPSTEPRDGAPVDVLIIGAGNINFGSDEGPWNHSQRLELKLGSRLRVVGLVDPAIDRAQGVMDLKRLTLAGQAYANTIIYPSLSAATSALANSPPSLVVVGSPPAFRGRLETPFNVEDHLSEAFPKAALFVEKPLSTGPVEGVKAVSDLLDKRGPRLVSIGYMLRYSKAVQEMKRIIQENNLKVMMTSARYVMAYEHSTKLAWWNKSIDCGPIVEQATHFCDLSRYFGGEVDLRSIMAHALEWDAPPGALSKLNIDESLIPEKDRIPRFTSATWKYDSGALGHLEHGVALQGTEFSTEFTIFADGYQLKLIDPYNRPTLYIRRPGSESEEVHTFHDDDPFLSEFSTLIDVMDGVKDSSGILSSYVDAAKTYEMSWAIRLASEQKGHRT